MAAGLRWTPALAAALCLTGCSGWQSALDAGGPQSAEIKWLFLIFVVLSACIWTAVVLVLLIGLLQRRASSAGPLDVDAASERTAGRTILGFSIATAAVVLGLSVLSYVAQRTVFAKSADTPVVRVIGHQWWWEIHYEGDPDRSFTTANEIRIPVDTPVTLKLETRDVIHSFWVPALAGKMDLINNQENQLQLTATRPGVYRGQCAEFCGLQHAHMAVQVIALPHGQYEAWRTHQTEPARPSSNADMRRGEVIFRARGCALCHTVRGTLAGGRLGPDLTHLASRRTIAAGTLPLTPGNLAGWISNPQHIKPGNLMPAVPLSGDDLNTLVRYLGSLQ